MIDVNSKFCIIFNSEIPTFENSLSALEKALNDYNLQYTINDIHTLSVDSCENSDFVFVIGGDGTILRCAKLFAKVSVPVLGLNIGRLGFLSQLTKDDIVPAVERILNNRFTVERRLMLNSLELTALNDVVIKGISGSRTGKFSLKINDKFVSEYIADGMIISTPTGSTAYGLSAGGPVLYPKLEAIVVVPICPHTLTARPLVIPATENITVLSSEKNMNFNLNIDGDDCGVIEPCVQVSVSPIKAHLALLDDDFYSVLRQKFNWGVAPQK